MLLHPPLTHFAIALPVVTAVFGLLFLITRKEGLSKITARMLVVTALVMIAAWYTGSKAGPEIFDYLSKDGKHELLEHKNLGLYLAIAFSLIAVVQFLGCQLKKFAIQAVAILLLFAATVMTFVQGKDGGEIVYNHGMPFKAEMMLSTLKEAGATAEDTEDCDEKVEAYEDAVYNINTLSGEVQAIYGEAEKEGE
ncbi:hypothetical protein LOH54_12515 [Sulfurimonas sp. HSL-3221]|uniref:DUF2231 domain-containing protein n=1 Tax=Sulfurimonadaceae TaxID=2771471 RepID=UPI001E361705|nr:DUF2231 domain-containing protein [Sulfurimonas sp. HSL-3221]UFS62457.1 hypothetical protein LOH54_12515 [Sulfurimonas sp. HSL-3221]